MQATTSGGSRYSVAISTPSLTWFWMMTALTSGSSSSCGLAMPCWFSMKKCGCRTLPMSWYSAATVPSSGSAPTSRQARSVRDATMTEWL